MNRGTFQEHNVLHIQYLRVILSGTIRSAQIELRFACLSPQLLDKMLQLSLLSNGHYLPQLHFIVAPLSHLFVYFPQFHWLKCSADAGVASQAHAAWLRHIFIVLVERRRRDYINSQITRLSGLLPADMYRDV